MKCKAFFIGKDNCEQNRLDKLTHFKEKSTWTPEEVDPALELFLKTLEDRVLAVKVDGNNYSNLSAEERAAIRNLKNYGDIVIKGADKGSAVVVWGTKEYCAEAYRQLAESTIYERVEGNPIQNLAKEIDTKLKVMKDKGIILEENHRYLRGRESKLGRFYLLPKIHKRLVNVPGRPVVSNCGTATERLSEFVDFHLQPFVKVLPHVIKDTTDFLKRLEGLGDIPDSAILCSMDVVGLYPHIPHEEGLRSLKEVLDYYESEVNFEGKRVPCEDLIDLARLILENNYFEFDNNIYWQKLGTAIGTKFAPSFANIFMSQLECKMLSEYLLSPLFWWRYLDDIFFIWLHGEKALLEFFEYVNNYHDIIKYTWEWSETELSYLDVLVQLRDNRISTDLYSKPTDTHQYLDSKSCHPGHVKSGIPYGQALRMRRICGSNDVFEGRLKDLRGSLVKRGFKESLIDKQFSKARVKKRGDLLCQNKRNKGEANYNRMPLVINFHPALSGIARIIDSLWPVLQVSEAMKRIFKERPLVAFRRPRNLKDELVRSKLKNERVVDKGMKKCGKSRCKICAFVEEGCEFEGENRKFKINFSFDCDSVGVIYLILCKRCRKKYVGSTITSFRKRFNNHKSSIVRYGKGQRGIPGEHLYSHFYEEGHEGIKDILVKVIDKTNMSKPTDREGFWAYKLNSFVPNGLNIRDFL